MKRLTQGVDRSDFTSRIFPLRFLGLACTTSRSAVEFSDRIWVAFRGDARANGLCRG